jgi:hypothetical protein
MTATALPPDDIDTSFVPRFREAVAAIPVAEEAVLYEEDTGDLHRLDAIGAVVCSLFDGRTSITTAVDELVAAFGAPRDTIQTDVMRLVRELGFKGLLEGVTTPTPIEVEQVDDGC